MLKKSNIAVFLFFAAYLCAGLIIFKDYGISWDEPSGISCGRMALRYALEGDKTLLGSENKYFGPVWAILLIALEKIFNLADNSRSVYFMRHLVNFLFFYIGVFFFYLLAKRNFKSWKAGLLASLFLILSPRIFADSFYNAKDIPFLVLFTITMYTLIRFLNSKLSVLTAFLHALLCALLIGIRVIGILVPFFTTLFFVADLFILKPLLQERKKAATAFVAYIFFLGIFTILFWPILWANPLYHFIHSLMQMAHYPERVMTLYLGRHLAPTEIPWHYAPVWILITTPLLYSFCFFIGCFVLVKQFLKNPARFYVTARDNLIFLTWLFLPLFAVIILKSSLYDAWRQMFYIYPAFLLIVLRGIVYIFGFLKDRFHGRVLRIITAVCVTVMAAGLINIAGFMIRHHPFQNLYFNILAGRDMRAVKKNFDLDYWGLSYRKGLEYILRNDPDKIIKVCVANKPGLLNSYILSNADQKRLQYVDEISEAEYFLSNYRWHSGDYAFKEKFYSINIGRAKIMVVYKLK